ncbi:MAG: hypothetical protein ACYDDF_00575 [Thermoplasmatota archaeon]
MHFRRILPFFALAAMVCLTAVPAPTYAKPIVPLPPPPPTPVPLGPGGECYLTFPPCPVPGAWGVVVAVCGLPFGYCWSFPN